MKDKLIVGDKVAFSSSVCYKTCKGIFTEEFRCYFNHFTINKRSVYLAVCELAHGVLDKEGFEQTDFKTFLMTNRVVGTLIRLTLN